MFIKQGRKQLRIKSWDYSENGYYFVTMNVQDGKYLMGKVINGKMALSKIGDIVKNSLLNETPEHFEDLEIDIAQVMPNHIHAIFIINHCRGEVPSPMGAETAPLQRKTLGQIIAFFKYQTTKLINKSYCGKNNLSFWQRNYYEHVIRNEFALCRIREYIVNNPLRWEQDKYNSESKTPMKKRGIW